MSLRSKGSKKSVERVNKDMLLPLKSSIVDRVKKDMLLSINLSII